MDEHSRRVLAVGERAVERARRKSFSRQEQYKDNGHLQYANDFYQSIYSWVKLGVEEIKQKVYQVDSRKRDEWLREFWKKEAHWAGIINQMVLVDSARPWILVGGQRQVRRYATILHEANDGKGWRHFFRQGSLSYHTTDFGFTTEVGRDGKGGPLRGIFYLDSARCKWSGKRTTPLLYYPLSGKRQFWREEDYFNICSLPSDDVKMRGLGFCATSRAFELIKLLYGVLMHDEEMVGSRMMRGLLLLAGIEQNQWDQAMDAREEAMAEAERKYFGGVYVLATLGADIDAKLVPLSQLPENFDRRMFIDQTLFAYSLVAGFDVREFWPVSSGQLGTATESEMQHRKSATKGTLEVAHAWQERFQQELPESLHFQFEERDTDAELVRAEMADAWVKVARDLYDMPQMGQDGIIERNEAREMLVQKGIIPPEWTEAREATVVSDEKGIVLERRMLSLPKVRMAAERYPAEPIVVYRWTPYGGTERVLWESGDEALKKRVF